MEGIYGSNYQQFLLSKDVKEPPALHPLPEKLSREYLAVIQMDRIISLLNEIVNHEKESNFDAVITKAAQDIIGAMKDIHLDDIAENVRNQELMKELLSAGKKGDNEKLLQLLSDGNSIAEGLKNVVSFAKWIPLIV